MTGRRASVATTPNSYSASPPFQCHQVVWICRLTFSCSLLVPHPCKSSQSVPSPFSNCHTSLESKQATSLNTSGELKYKTCARNRLRCTKRTKPRNSHTCADTITCNQSLARGGGVMNIIPFRFPTRREPNDFKKLI